MLLCCRRGAESTSLPVLLLVVQPLPADEPAGKIETFNLGT
jgi:hypothetical protein